MELLLLPSSSSSSSPTRNVFQLSHPTFLSFHNVSKRHSNARTLIFPHLRAQPSESVQASRTSNWETTDVIKPDICSKDENLVFVAGATGKVGSRTVRELLKLGFRVRAGVRSAQRAETLVQSVQQLKLDDGASAVEKLELVECDLEGDKIEAAIGNASIVICCIGASEKEVFDITGPYRIDYQATKNLIDAATVAGVDHFILLTSLGTNKIGFPAAILNLFWGVLIWKRKAEEALIASGLPYTIVRPGGMERPTDTYKETHNVSLAKEDTLFGGQVSNLQVAELIAFMAGNRDLSYCKVVEVIAETTAPLSPFGELLSKIPSQRVNISSQKGLQTAKSLDAAPSRSVIPVGKTSVIEKKPAKTDGSVIFPSPYIVYEDLNPPTAPPTPSTSPSATMAINTQEAVIKPVPSSTQDSSMKDNQNSGTLSPYIVYDDLKPPTSPTPIASSGTKGGLIAVQAVSEPNIAADQIDVSGLTITTTETVSSPSKVQDTQPLSPYFVYEDLKPPASPTPTSNAMKKGSVTAVKPENEAAPSFSGGSVVTEKAPTKMVEGELPEVSGQKTSYLSPYPVYDDFKPPASPSPGAPKLSPVLPSTSDVEPQLSSEQTPAATLDRLEDEKHFSEPKPRPLSPFYMYEDLKPPSSPVPSPGKC